MFLLSSFLLDFLVYLNLDYAFFVYVYVISSWLLSYIKYFASSQPYYLGYEIFVSPRVALTQSFILVFHHRLKVLVVGYITEESWSFCLLGIDSKNCNSLQFLTYVFFLFFLTYFSLLLHFSLRRCFKKDYESLSHVFTITLGLF